MEKLSFFFLLFALLSFNKIYSTALPASASSSFNDEYSLTEVSNDGPNNNDLNIRKDLLRSEIRSTREKVKKLKRHLAVMQQMIEDLESNISVGGRHDYMAYANPLIKRGTTGLRKEAKKIENEKEDLLTNIEIYEELLHSN